MEPSAAQLAALRSPFDELVGTRIVEASGTRVVALLEVRPDHHQPFGIVHGGVYTTLIEGATSVGATLALDGRGAAMGIANATDFVRSVKAGTLRVEAVPVQSGRTLQLWRATVTDEENRLVAHGTVRLYNRGGPDGAGDPPESPAG